jgi:hypothetical protein
MTRPYMEVVDLKLLSKRRKFSIKKNSSHSSHTSFPSFLKKIEGIKPAPSLRKCSLMNS